jgi:hypothetical protein
MEYIRRDVTRGNEIQGNVTRENEIRGISPRGNDNMGKRTQSIRKPFGTRTIISLLSVAR